QIAPYKAAVLPLMKKPELMSKANQVFDLLKNEFVMDFDVTGSIGKRYRRQDEIGTPYAITIDFDAEQSTFVSGTGEVVFSYVGRNTGVDVIEIVENDFEAFRRLAIVEVNWTAEADLVVPLFAPPLVFASENDTIFITETTSNVGTVDVVAPSATSYYITDTDNITADNIDTASFLGERIIPPLAAGESSHASEQEFVIPSGFTGDVHFLAACADDDEEIVESNEENNCSYTEVERVFDVGVLIEDPNANNPPLANDQVVVTDQDNPVSVTLTGQDNDGDTLTFSINSGPVNGALSGTAR
ncbi:MAG: hypothetical protein IH984_10145, partial [Planctomycetes bacterium]|nr:hypothetical protein [Planctomycetota bacterium]